MQRPGLFALVTFMLGLVGLVLAVAAPWERYSKHWYTVPSLPRPGRGAPDEIRRAVYADGRLWVLAGGEVWAIEEHPSSARRTGVSAYEICEHRGALLAVSPDPHGSGAWNVVERKAGKWQTIAWTDSHGAGLVGLECSSVVRLLTSDRLITIDGAAQSGLPLSQRIPAWPHTVILGAGAHLLVGIDAGEWGGSLWRINSNSGAVEQLGGSRRQAVCAVPLDLACEPINSIVDDPWRSGCALVAVGSILGLRGGLLEVCGTQLRQLALRDARDVAPTVTRFGLVATPRGLVTNTVSGVELLRADGALTPEDRLSFTQSGPFQVGRQYGLAIVRAASDERFHPGGSNGVAVQVAN